MIYETWLPIDGIESAIFLESLHDDLNELKIRVSEGAKKRILVIKFSHVLSYMNTLEGELFEDVGPDTFRGTFLKIKDSLYLNKFQNEGFKNYEHDKYAHYRICPLNNIIDIISVGDVYVGWEEN